MLACAWIVAFFPVLANTTLGLKSVDHNLADLFRLYGASRWQVLRDLKLPAAMPYVLGGLKIAGGLSLIGAVVAEIAAGSAGAGSGLAYRIAESGYRLNIPRMFAALLLLSVAGVVIFFSLSLALASVVAALARERIDQGCVGPATRACAGVRPGCALPAAPSVMQARLDCSFRSSVRAGTEAGELSTDRIAAGTQEEQMHWIASFIATLAVLGAAPAQAQTYPSQADPHPDPLCARRHRRHRRPHRRRQADRSLGPAGGGREQARRQRLHRHDVPAPRRPPTATR